MAYSLSRTRRKFIEWKSEAAPKELFVDLNRFTDHEFSLEKGWEELWDEENEVPYFWSTDCNLLNL
jgi:GH18 family chitinase